MVDVIERLHGPPRRPAFSLPNRWYRPRRPGESLVRALPTVLDQLSRGLRTGLTLRQSIERTAARTTGPMAARLESVVVALQLGVEPERAAARFHWPGDPRVLAVAAVVLGISLRDGAGAAETLDGLAGSVRRDESVREAARVLTAQARLSARVLTALPPAFVGLGLVSGSDQPRLLLTTATGRLCLGAGSALLLTGLLWMRTLIEGIDS